MFITGAAVSRRQCMDRKNTHTQARLEIRKKINSVLSNRCILINCCHRSVSRGPFLRSECEFSACASGRQSRNAAQMGAGPEIDRTQEPQRTFLQSCLHANLLAISVRCTGLIWLGHGPVRRSAVYRFGNNSRCVC